MVVRGWNKSLFIKREFKSRNLRDPDLGELKKLMKLNIVSPAEVEKTIKALHPEVKSVRYYPKGQVAWKVRTGMMNVKFRHDGKAYPLSDFDIILYRLKNTNAPLALSMDVIMRKKFHAISGENCDCIECSEYENYEECEYQDCGGDESCTDASHYNGGAYYIEPSKVDKLGMHFYTESICFGDFNMTNTLRRGDVLTALDATLTVLVQPEYEGSSPMQSWDEVFKKHGSKLEFCGFCYMPEGECSCGNCGACKSRFTMGGCTTCLRCANCGCKCELKKKGSGELPRGIMAELEAM